MKLIVVDGPSNYVCPGLNGIDLLPEFTYTD